jgi:hypothetical protein
LFTWWHLDEHSKRALAKVPQSSRKVVLSIHPMPQEKTGFRKLANLYLYADMRSWLTTKIVPEQRSWTTIGV